MRWKIVWLLTTLGVATGTSTVSISSEKISLLIDGADEGHDITQANPVSAHKGSEIYNKPHYSKQNSDKKSDSDIETRNLVKSDVDISENVEEDLVVETQYGPVKGINQEEITKYIDIPYGKFKLFEAPNEPDTWSKIKRNTEHVTRCPQIEDNTYVGTTDCLTLSVFTPKSAINADVLFYIHESNFKTGSGDPLVYGPEYLVKKGIVLVLPNFRLGPLGFLCLRNSTAPGNAALKDLTLALKWTHNNIQQFGGNPSNIVVSGDGSSSALAGFLALSPSSTGYFKKVIFDSGTVLSYWAIDRHPVETAIKLAEYIRQSSTTEQRLEDSVFSDIDVETLIKASTYTQFKPCVENNDKSCDFMSKSPWAILTNENETLSKTFMIGSPQHAGLFEAVQYEGNALSELNSDFSSVIPNDLVFKTEKLKQDFIKKTKEQYFGEDDITLSKFSMYQTDVSYAGPDIRLARALVNAGATVYFYEFSFIGELNKELQNIKEDLRFGAMRGDIKGYLFNQDGVEVSEEFKDEKEMIEIMTNLWANFIKTGKPTSAGIEWKHLNESDDSEQWLSIGENVSAEAGYHPERLDLWTEVYRDHYVDGNAALAVKALELIYYFGVFCFVKLTNGFILKEG